MNRTYELMFIVRPDMVDEELDKLISTLETAVTSTGGTVKVQGTGGQPAAGQRDDEPTGAPKGPTRRPK